MIRIKDLIEILPQIILYIVTGYLLSSTYHFITFKEMTDKNTEHILISSLVIGYIYCQLMYIIPISFSQEIDMFGMIIFSIIIGYMAGRFFKSKYIISIFNFLKIRETGNTYYWDDLLDTEYPMKARIILNKTIYEGMIHFYQGYSNEPNVILGSYVVKDYYNAIINDYRNDNNKVIVLNTSKADSVEIIYDIDSPMCDYIQDLCNIYSDYNEKYN